MNPDPKPSRPEAVRLLRAAGLVEGSARKEKPACQVRRLSVARLTHSVAGHDKILP